MSLEGGGGGGGGYIPAGVKVVEVACCVVAGSAQQVAEVRAVEQTSMGGGRGGELSLLV